MVTKFPGRLNLTTKVFQPLLHPFTTPFSFSKKGSFWALTNRKWGWASLFGFVHISAKKGDASSKKLDGRRKRSNGLLLFELRKTFSAIYILYISITWVSKRVGEKWCSSRLLQKWNFCSETWAKSDLSPCLSVGPTVIVVARSAIYLPFLDGKWAPLYFCTPDWTWGEIQSDFYSKAK